MSRQKSRPEARVERLTWFAMVLVFMFISLDERFASPGYWVPIAISIILFMSGIIQYQRRWRVGPFTWIVAAVLLVVGGLGYYFQLPEVNIVIPFFDPVLISLIATIIVIGYGVISNES